MRDTLLATGYRKPWGALDGFERAVNLLHEDRS
jgi:hypothetical protein